MTGIRVEIGAAVGDEVSEDDQKSLAALTLTLLAAVTEGRHGEAATLVGIQPANTRGWLCLYLTALIATMVDEGVTVVVATNEPPPFPMHSPN